MIGSRGRARGLIGAGIAAMVLVSAGAEPRRGTMPARPSAADDLTFRPTVVIRKGVSQGSGSVIASVNGETLVLTAAHVVQDPGDLTVALHRYNLGVEHKQSSERWPRQVPAEVAAEDVAADVAVLRIRGMVALPYVAKLAEKETEPEPGTPVTSLGIDLATHLSSWRARVHGVISLDLKRKGGPRPFIVTDQAPEHGRSGGGLFRDDGTLVGLCVGRVDGKKDPSIGIFASGESIHRLLRQNALEEVVARSGRGRVASRRPARSHVAAPLTETEHRVRPRRPEGSGGPDDRR